MRNFINLLHLDVILFTLIKSTLYIIKFVFISVYKFSRYFYNTALAIVLFFYELFYLLAVNGFKFLKKFLIEVFFFVLTIPPFIFNLALSVTKLPNIFKSSFKSILSNVQLSNNYFRKKFNQFIKVIKYYFTLINSYVTYYLIKTINLFLYTFFYVKNLLNNAIYRAKKFFLVINLEVINIIAFFKNIAILIFNIAKTIYYFFKPATLLVLYKNIILLTKNSLKNIKYYVINNLLNDIKKLVIGMVLVFKNIVLLLHSVWLFIVKFYKNWVLSNYFKFAYFVILFVIIASGSIFFYKNSDLFVKNSNKWGATLSIANSSNFIISLVEKAKIHSSLKYYHVNLEVREGSSLAAMFSKENINQTQVTKIIQNIKQYSINTLRPGVVLHTTLSQEENSEERKVQRVVIPISNTKDLIVEAKNLEDDTFISYTQPRKLTRYVSKRTFNISSSFYASAYGAGVPKQIINMVSNILSWHIDFQREIHNGNTVEILYECLYTSNNVLVSCDNLIYTSVNLDKQKLSFYNYRNEYYLPDGHSAERTLLKTPIDGARISSGFGFRMHPILGYGAFHKGIDFAVPLGTPVPASGDGIITKMAISSSYGKWIEIRHNNFLGTRYAHLSAFAPGMHVGSRVHQRDIIAYSGSTGRSTGAHLHYEILINNKQVNPLKVTFPSAHQLNNANFIEFNKFKQEVDLMLLRLPNQTNIITNDITQNTLLHQISYFSAR